MCVAVNDQWASLVHADPTELLGEPIGALLSERQTAEALSRLCDLVALTRSRRRLRLPPVAGLPRDATAEPLDRQTGPAPAVVVRLRESRPDAPTFSQMRRALEAEAPTLVATFDRDLRVVTVNEAVERISGLDRSEMIGLTNAEMGYPPAIADLWDGHHREVIATGRSRVVSYSLPTVLGPRPYESHIEPVIGHDGGIDGVSVTSRDVTLPRLAADRRRQRHVRAALAAGSAAYWQFDPVEEAVGEARRKVVGWLREAGTAELVDEAALVVSELATNAVIHAGTVFYVHVQRLDEGVRIEVLDGSPIRPVSRPSGTLGGRGLVLVAAVGCWGARMVPDGGKVVWCEVTHPMEASPREATSADLIDFWSDRET